MSEITEKGVRFLGFTIPWDWLDSIFCNLIKKADASIITDPAVEKLDSALQGLVDNTDFKFDNVGKAKLEKAFTLSMVKKFMPELIEPNP